VAALDQLELAVHTTGSASGRGAAGAGAWQAALAAAARRLESAWLALDAGARREQEYWASEIARVRAWRRPTWPLWLITAVVAGAATYLGLVLGGYLPVPPPLEGLAAFWWARL
jgi:ferric-dicitrate binding protein FerR (iron transport regulator)